jgi:hypothetical protein
MSYKVHIYVKRPPSPSAVDLGEMEITERPVLIQQVSFEHEGNKEIGVIEQIDPGDWETRGVVPKIYIVLNPTD